MSQIIIDGIQTSAVVAGDEFLRLPGFWIESARHMPLTRGGLTLPDPDGARMQRVQAGDAVTLVTGYRGGSPSLWQAEVTWKRPGATEHQIELGLVGADKVLARTRMTGAFTHTTPEAIVRYALAKGGVALGRIDAPGVEVPRFVVSNESIWQTVEKLELTLTRAFGLDMSAWALWMDAEGAAHWGDFDDPGQTSIPAAVTGGNLINHSPATDATGLGTVETFLLPGLMHSQQFRLQDMYRGIHELYRCQRVRHESDGGRVRTVISYGPERGRYS